MDGLIWLNAIAPSSLALVMLVAAPILLGVLAIGLGAIWAPLRSAFCLLAALANLALAGFLMAESSDGAVAFKLIEPVVQGLTLSIALSVDSLSAPIVVIGKHTSLPADEAR